MTKKFTSAWKTRAVLRNHSVFSTFSCTSNVLTSLLTYPILLMVLLISFSDAVSQSKLPQVVPVSPNAAVMAKYGETPVSLYNGTANLTVPLYQVQSGDITVPVSLEYRTVGIKVDELAGWTGLGWNLECGGIITRQVKSWDDLTSGAQMDVELATKSQFTSQVNVLSNYDHEYKPLRFELKTKDNETFDYTNIIGSMAGLNHEYDIFSYSFMNRSGRFIIAKSGEIVLEKQDDIKIKYFVEDNLHRFKITDERGFTYYFKTVEKIEVQSPLERSVVSSWYLSRIESAHHFVEFVYEDSPTLARGRTIENQVFQCVKEFGGQPGFNHNAMVVPINKMFSVENAKILNRINFNTGHLEFKIDSDRVDYSGKRITGLKVFSEFAADPVKEYDFTYSYFYDDVANNQGQYKRLRLDKVTEKAGNITLPPYEFTYNELSPYGLPISFQTKSKDHWGYYNGFLNSTLLPKFSGFVGMLPKPDFLKLDGANRASNPEHMKLFSLREVRYPTQGKTIFDTEANTYDYTLVQSNEEGDYDAQVVTVPQSIEFRGRGEHTDVVNASNAISPTVHVSIAFITSTDNGWQQFKNTYEKIYIEVGGMRRDIGGTLVNCIPDKNRCVVEFDVPKGAISWKAFIHPSISSDFVMIHAMLTWEEKVITQIEQQGKDKFLYCGGLRVKKITDYDHQGAIVKSRAYEYHYSVDNNGDGIADENRSYGKRLTIPSYNRFMIIPYANDLSFCWNFHRYDYNLKPHTKHIGYDQVTEYVVDNAGKSLNGKTVYTFINKPDSVYNYHWDVVKLNFRPVGGTDLVYQTNGLQTSRTDFVQSGLQYYPVREIKHDYSASVLNQYFSLYWEPFQQLFDDWDSYFPEQEYIFGTRSVHLFIPYLALRPEKITLNKTTEIIYHDPNDLSKKTIAEINYDYGASHVQVVKQATKNSDGTTTTIRRIYPPDYGNLSSSTSGIKNLKERNIIAVPVEEYTVHSSNATGEQVVAGTLTTFKDNAPLPDKVSVLESCPIPVNEFIPSNKVSNQFAPDEHYKSKLLFHEYDNKGNIQSVSRQNDIKMLYIWGYKGVRPIAEIKGATSLNDVAYASFDNNESGNWTITNSYRNGYDALSGRNSYDISSGELRKSDLTVTRHYVISYWKKNGACSISGAADVTTRTGKAVSGWTYYEHEFKATATTISLSGTAMVDEVRLYPKGAMMTTYVYEPLYGLTTSTSDANGIITYYKYDSLGRLIFVRDADQNIVKRYDYQYLNTGR
jgi:YD repeat-containing protein